MTRRRPLLPPANRVRGRWLVLVSLVGAVIGVLALFPRERSESSGHGADTPPPAPILEVSATGASIAVIDVAALAAWSRERGLPAPPEIPRAEPSVAKALVDAVHRAGIDGSAAAMGRAGEVSLALKAFRSAADYFERAAALDPRSSRWPYLLGCTLQVAGEADGALAALAHAAKIGAVPPVAHARMGQIHLDQGRLDEAERAFGTYSELRPDDPLGQVGQGRVSFERGRHAEALARLEEAARRGPADFQTQYWLGRSLAALGRDDEARERLALAGKLPQGLWFAARDPLEAEVKATTDSTAALVAQLERLGGSQDWPRLGALVEEILRQRPNDPGMLGNLARIRRKQGRFEEAHQALNRAAPLLPDSAELPAIRAEVLLAERRDEEAIAAADRSLALDPDRAVAHSIRGRALFQLGRMADADSSLRRAVALAPEDASTLLVLAEALRRQGEVAEARTTLQRVLALEPGNATAAGLLASLEAAQRR